MNTCKHCVIFDSDSALPPFFKKKVSYLKLKSLSLLVQADRYHKFVVNLVHIFINFIFLTVRKCIHKQYIVNDLNGFLQFSF